MKNEVVPPPVGQACSIIHGAAILGFTRLSPVILGYRCNGMQLINPISNSVIQGYPVHPVTNMQLK